jgi:predicted NAD/FAD-binding protein
MNVLQGLVAPERFLVTLNRNQDIDPATVLGSYVYHHPVYTPGAVAAQRRYAEVNGVNRTYYCGAYWGNGFHEDGVVSAQKMLQAFDDGVHAAVGAAREQPSETAATEGRLPNRPYAREQRVAR